MEYDLARRGPSILVPVKLTWHSVKIFCAVLTASSMVNSSLEDNLRMVMSVCLENSVVPSDEPGEPPGKYGLLNAVNDGGGKGCGGVWTGVSSGECCMGLK